MLEPTVHFLYAAPGCGVTAAVLAAQVGVVDVWLSLPCQSANDGFL